MASTCNETIMSQSLDWIVEHSASNQNSDLLRALFNDVDFENCDSSSFLAQQLLNITHIRHLICTTPYDDLWRKLICEENILKYYHQLYPSVLLNSEDIASICSSKEEECTLTRFTAQLFENEIELKTQIILSMKYWNNNYILHKKLNDELLHHDHYTFTGDTASSLNAFIPPLRIIEYITKCANGHTFITRIHQQLNYLGQQCTKPSMNLNNINDENVHKINEFLHKHAFNSFKTDFLKLLDIAQHRICLKNSDFLNRLSRADIDKILINRNYASKYQLRTVVDVCVGGNWCPGTVIQRFDDGSLKIALHSDEFDENGLYQYDTHYRVNDLTNVILCINEDGEIETDQNLKLVIDTNTSITKQYQIKQRKQNKTLQFKQILENRNKNKKASQTSDNTDITEPLLSDELLSPKSIKEKQKERKEQFVINTNNNNKNKEEESPSRRRRKRSREEFENEGESELKQTTSDSTQLKRRKMERKSKKQKNETKQRKKAEKKQKDKEKRKKKKEKEGNKKKKKKIQTQISGTKDKMITFTKNNKKHKNERDKEDEDEGEGEEQRWSDDMTEEMKKLDVKNTKKMKREIWKKEEEDALKKCYKKHDKIRKKMQKYAIWDQIKRDSEYCKYWKNRSPVSIRDKARTLLGLNTKKKK